MRLSGPLSGLWLLLLPGLLLAADPAPSKELSPREQQLVEMLTGCSLVGSYSIDGRADRLSQSEAYWIESVRKAEGDTWIITATMSYGDVKVPIPVPVEMHWAGETPMLQVTNLSIPLLGDGFSTRLLFHEGRYAGTWGHGSKGGHMWGKLVRRPKAEATGSTAPEQP